MDESDEVRRNVGLRIVELRRAKKITQEKLAERISMDTRDLRRIEAGQVNVTIDTMVKIAGALEVRTAELFQATSAKPDRRPGRPAR